MCILGKEGSEGPFVPGSLPMFRRLSGYCRPMKSHWTTQKIVPLFVDNFGTVMESLTSLCNSKVCFRWRKLGKKGKKSGPGRPFKISAGRNAEPLPANYEHFADTDRPLRRLECDCSHRGWKGRQPGIIFLDWFVWNVLRSFLNWAYWEFHLRSLRRFMMRTYINARWEIHWEVVENRCSASLTTCFKSRSLNNIHDW